MATLTRKLFKKVETLAKIAKGAWFYARGQIFSPGPSVERNYARDFSRAPIERQPHKFLRPQEVEDADEASDLIPALMATFASDVEPGFGRACPGGQDPHWGSTLYILKGTLDITELDWLDDDERYGKPGALRAGLFSEPRQTLPVICRVNFLYDDDPLIAIVRLSLKVELETPIEAKDHAEGYPSRTLDLLLSEGLPPGDIEQPDGQGFFFRDARQLLLANEVKGDPQKGKAALLDRPRGKVLWAWRKIFKSNTDRLYRGRQTELTWSGRHYYSAGPYALGEGMMKFSLSPVVPTTSGVDRRLPEPLDPRYGNPALAHRENTQVKPDLPIDFDLALQVATEDAINVPGDPTPKAIMATEYCDIGWNAARAPFRKVGRVTLHTLVEDDTSLKSEWHAVPFNAWNTFNANRPLGQLFRARRSVHAHHRAERLARSYGDPGAVAAPMCPFAKVSRSDARSGRDCS